MVEMVIGLPIKKGEDIFIRDEDGNITGQKNTPVEVREEHAEELARRKEYHDKMRAKQYVSERGQAYPDYGDFADMMYWKIDSAIRNGGEVTTGEYAWYEKCKAVKEKFPKPTV